MDDDGVDGLNGLVKVFELRRITAIVVLCLPMDRANALFHSRNQATQELYHCWLGPHHAQEIGPKHQNKHYWWLLNTEELFVTGPQVRDLMEKWLLLARANPDDSTPLNRSEYRANSQIPYSQKNLVIFFDGTGKHIKDKKRSYVGKLVKLLDSTNCSHCYVEGLGRFVTDKWNPADPKRKTHELAGGRGIFAKVLEAYQYLVRKYKNGCQSLSLDSAEGHILHVS